MWPAASKTVKAVSTWPATAAPNETGFNLAHNTSNSFFDELSKDSSRSIRFADAMNWQDSVRGTDVTYLTKDFDFSAVGDGLFVDVGGNSGLVARHVADNHPEIRCVVEDLADPIKHGRETLPAELARRVQFVEYDFITKPQPVANADVYLLRNVLHDWADKQAINILKNLTPALKHGATILVNDYVLQEHHFENKSQARALCAFDLAMLALFNAGLRSLEQWISLFKRADSRFRVVQLHQNHASAMALLEMTWHDP
ncbi:MAG: hypothetical protein Q9162_005141 [Coniocarpon cinnabarinum]